VGVGLRYEVEERLVEMRGLEESEKGSRTLGNDSKKRKNAPRRCKNDTENRKNGSGKSRKVP
jgi:hypothetical protein